MGSGHQSRVAGKDPKTSTRHPYDGAVRFQVDASPFAGGWTPYANYVSTNFGAPMYEVSGLGEACATADANPGGQVEMSFSLDSVIRENLTDAPGVVATLQKLHLRYYRTDGASVIGIYLYETPKAGGGYPTLVDSWTQAAEFTVAGPGPWTQYSDGSDLGHSLDVETNSYHLRLLIQNTNKGECRVGVLLLDIDKTAVE